MKRIMILALSLMLVCSVLHGCSGSGSAVPAGKIDLDLSQMSGTAVYSQIYNIMSTPEEYLGKTIKLKGNFSIYENVVTKEVYYACVIPDATACCQQGIEFSPKKEMRYPDDFPPLQTEIEVCGVFTAYDEDGNTYYELQDSEMNIV